MILVIGGRASGRTAFARLLARALALPDDAVLEAESILPSAAAHYSADEGRAVQAVPLLDKLVQTPIVTCLDAGSGIVPATACQRASAARLADTACILAEAADTVVHMRCGIPVVVKGVPVVLMRHGQTESNRLKRYLGTTDEPLDAEGEAIARAARAPSFTGSVFTSPLSRARQTARLCFPHARLVTVDGLREMDFGSFEGKSYLDLSADAAYRLWVEDGCVGACPGGEDRARFTERACEAFLEALSVSARSGSAANGAASGLTAHPESMKQNEPAASFAPPGPCEPAGSPEPSARANRLDALGHLERACRSAIDRGRNPVVIVAHGGTIMAIMSRFACDPPRDDTVDDPFYRYWLPNCAAWRAWAVQAAGSCALIGCTRTDSLDFLDERYKIDRTAPGSRQASP